jgi:SAM-dependent methyltransferase
LLVKKELPKEKWMAISYSFRLSIKDFWQSIFLRTFFIQRRLRKHLREQNQLWPKEKRYTQGYFYQGLEELGITGAKPTGFRFAQYQVDDILKNKTILDIGSNCGFVASYCAQRSFFVTAVELNPFLNRIARDTVKYLKLNNIAIIENDFSTFTTDQRFDVILSFSNHHTIDGNLHMGFEHYIQKIVSLLNPGGYLLFESHNVFAEGKGNVGDDGDMENKVAIMNKYFDIERYKMVRCYLKHGVEDLDKLFIVAKQSLMPQPVAFNLQEARQKYEY